MKEIRLIVPTPRAELLTIILETEALPRVARAGLLRIEWAALPEDVCAKIKAGERSELARLEQFPQARLEPRATFLAWRLESELDEETARVWEDIVPLRAQITDLGGTCAVTFWLEIDALAPALAAIVAELDRHWPGLKDQAAELGATVEPGTAPVGLEGLTDRQREVAELLANGLRRPEIAKRLMIHKDTVKTHMERIAVALGLDTTDQSVLEREIRRRLGDTGGQ